MNWSFGRASTLAFVLIFAVMVANGALDYWNTMRLRQQEKMLEQTIEFHGQKEEMDRLATQRRAATVSYTIAMIASGAGLLLGLIVVGLACHLTRRELLARGRAEEGLRRLNQTLEQRVAERTKAIQMLHDAATMANLAQNTEQAIEYCLRRVAMYDGWCFGHALMAAADNPDELIPAHACYAEDPNRFRHFREVTVGIRLRRGQGLPGRVFASGNRMGQRVFAILLDGSSKPQYLCF